MTHFSADILAWNPSLGISVQEHSRLLDKFFGFEVEQIENELLRKAKVILPDGNHKIWGHSLHDGQQTWVGLDLQTLQTPYHELVEICNFIRPLHSSHVIDLGAGYGRLGLVLSLLFPDVRFLGLEFVPERVQEGSRIYSLFNCSNAKLIQQDLSDEKFMLPIAEYYFIYDYGNLAEIRNTLKQLEGIVHQKKFKVIARGKGVRSLIQYEHPWLSQVFAPSHFENYSIYSMSLDLQDI